MTCLDRLEAYLRAHQVSFQTQRHYRAATAQQVAASQHVPGQLMAKVVMVFADEQLVMLVLPASHQLDLAKAAAGLGVQTLRLATEREFAFVFPDCEVGAMPPFGNLYGLPVYVDGLLAEDELIVFQTGTHTDTMSMWYVDYARLVAPVVLDLSQHRERFTVAAYA